VIERGYEGYVAKDAASTYQAGPTRRWLKVKQKDWTLAEDGWRRRIFEKDNCDAARDADDPSSDRGPPGRR
jgi:hypothetical protein